MMHAQVILQSDVAMRIVALLDDWRCGRDGRQSLLLDVARLVRPCVEARLSLLRAGILPVLVRLSAVIDPIRSALRSATGCAAAALFSEPFDAFACQLAGKRCTRKRAWAIGERLGCFAEGQQGACVRC
jgi:hypothetical protein